MNKFLSKFGFGSSSLATRDNSNNNSSNKKKKNSPRNIINARDAINNDVVKYIKNSLPRAQADGSLKCFRKDDIIVTSEILKINKKGGKRETCDEQILNISFPKLPIVDVPTKVFSDLYYIQAIYRVLNQKLDGQTRILEKKQWPINNDVINGLTRQDAIGYVKQLNLKNVFTREKQKKFGGSKHKCAIDALINERKKYVDEESS